MPLQSNKKLLECVEFIKKHQSKDVELNNKTIDSITKINDEIPMIVNNLRKDGAAADNYDDVNGHTIRVSVLYIFCFVEAR